MRPHVLTFEKPPSFNDLVARVRIVINVGCDMRLHGRYDMGGNKPIYVMLPLGSEDEWQLYKSCASQTGLKGAEIVTEIALLPIGEINIHDIGVTIEETIADPITVEQPSQEEWQGVTHRVSLGSELAKTISEALNLAVVIDEFDADTFIENIDTEQHIEEDDEIARSENDEEKRQPSVNTAPDAASDSDGEDNEANVPSSAITLCDILISNHIDWGSYYIDEELMALKLKLISLQDYPNHKDISHIGSAVCDSAVVDDEGNPRVREEVIKKSPIVFPGLHYTSPSTILCGEIKQRCTVHHKVPDFEL
jgi:hypothetical protein